MNTVNRLPAGARRVVVSLVDTVLPVPPTLPTGVRDRVRDDVVDFVAAQIRRMPAFLRLPYRLGLVGFELLALVRVGARFSHATPDGRRRYLSWWEGLPVGALRDFLKPVRGCALLAYFDHAAVRDALVHEAQTAASDARFTVQVVAPMAGPRERTA